MLYHVSFCEVPGGIFYPRIPQGRSKGEDETIKRVCFAKSIEDAVTAMPAGGRALKNMMMYAREAKILPVLPVYTMDESEIEPENLMIPEQIKKYVCDAICSGETWIIKEPAICEHTIIHVTDAITRDGFDMNGDEITDVISIECEPLPTLPENAPEAKTKLEPILIRAVFAQFEDILTKREA